MLNGATLRAAAMTGAAVFRMVVSSDSIKNATATSHGSNRLLEVRSEGGGAAFGMAASRQGFIGKARIEPLYQSPPSHCKRWSAALRGGQKMKIRTNPPLPRASPGPPSRIRTSLFGRQAASKVIAKKADPRADFRQHGPPGCSNWRERRFAGGIAARARSIDARTQADHPLEESNVSRYGLTEHSLDRC